MKHTNMMRFLAIAVALTSSAIHVSAWDSDKNQIWLDASIQGKLTDTLSIKLAEEVRYTESDWTYTYRHTDISLNWKFAPGWSISPAYRYTTKNEVNTPAWHLNLGNTLSALGMDIKSRMRVIYSDLSSASGRTDFRPKFTLIPSSGWTSWKLKPYLSDELMFNLNHGGLYRNRLKVGLKFSPVKRLSLGTFVMLDRKEVGDDWVESYHTGMSAALSF
ncbi:MAG: DUF2490 domain-containing protein [Pontiella sp.]